MQNITQKVVGTKLIIEVDLTHTIGPSASGKTVMIGSTEGNAKVEGWTKRAVQFGLNVFTKDGANGGK
jgi:hypothetical protein